MAVATSAPITSFELCPDRTRSPFDKVPRAAACALVQQSFFLILDIVLERKSLDDGVIAESLAQPIDGLLCFGGPAIDEIGKIRSIGIGQRRHPDADQAEHGAVDL